MIDSLYQPFKKWCDKGKIWIYSDPHFDDEEMGNFNYQDSKTQIENINKFVFKNDTLIMLGDIGNPEPLKGLKTNYKVLIRGNHDTSISRYSNYFNEIYKGALYISDKVLLSHEPIYNEFSYNIHGHLHNMDEVEFDCFHKNYLCVSANLIGYVPICLDDLFKNKGIFKEKRISLNEIKTIHRITIDKASEKNMQDKTINK